MQINHDIIAKLAYRYWEDRGKPTGSPEVDWFRAEATLAAAPRDLPLSAMHAAPYEGPWR